MTDPMGGRVEYDDSVQFVEVRAFKSKEAMADEGTKSTNLEARLTVQGCLSPWFMLMPDQVIAEMLYAAGDELTLIAEEFGPRETQPAEVIQLVKDPGPA